jgi:predicted nucleotidyltransferase
VRLTDAERVAIKLSAQDVFGAEVSVRVFGSRLDDDRRGGDIDLYVEAPEGYASIEASARFRRLLDLRVGEREYDIVLGPPGQPLSSIGRKAIAEGIVL